MERAVILLQSVNKLGNVGDEMNVKAGYARNFLIPTRKAIYATAGNRTVFAEKRKQIEAEHQQKLAAAEKIVSSLPDQLFCQRQAAEDGHLFGSVTSRDIVDLFITSSINSIERSMIDLKSAIKNLGVYEVNINIYGPVIAKVAINVARSADEADLQWEEHINPETNESDANVSVDVNSSVDQEQAVRDSESSA